MKSPLIILDERDNVGLLRIEANEGDLLDEALSLTAISPIPVYHKAALHDIAAGDAVRRYGQIIGYARCDIGAGAHVHTHNLESGVSERDYAYASEIIDIKWATADKRRNFQGYRRANGRAGTRNFIGLVTSVNCSATVARHIAQSAKESGLLDEFPNVDGIVPIVHGTGCGMSNQGEGYETIRRVLAGYMAHPNFGGVILLGLGCEVMQVADLMKTAGLVKSDTFRHFIIQESGGSRKTVERGLDALREMLPHVNQCKRESIPVSELVVALQCGGSDACSGISANPALGKAVDRLVEQGGTAILSETPEIYGAEHMLTRRAISRDVGKALVDRIKWWKNYAGLHGDSIDNNPSPGNKVGGLTTILEKSLGAQAKGGSTNLMGFYLYGEPITCRGLVFMDSPGYDPASVTGQVASGATLVCFTTGRGSAFGFKPSPTIKLATNSALYERQEEDMDINCGPVVDGDMTLDDMGDVILDKIIAVASGAPTKSEAYGYGDCEFVPWQIHANL